MAFTPNVGDIFVVVCNIFVVLLHFTLKKTFSQYLKKSIYIRAVSGISGSRVPDNRLGYPNPNFGSGTRNVALWVN